MWTWDSGCSSSQSCRACCALLWEPESRAERVITYRSSAPQAKASRYWAGAGQAVWGAASDSFIRHSSSARSRSRSSTKTLPPTRMERGTLRKSSSRRREGVRSQQLSTITLKLMTKIS